MKRIAIITCIITISIVDITAQNTVSKGIELLNAGKTKESLAVFTSILKKKPTDAEANYFAGIALCRSRRYEEAIPHLKVVINKNFKTTKIAYTPNNDSKLLLAKAYFHTYRFTAAIQLLESMVEDKNVYSETKQDANLLLARAKTGERLLNRYNPNDIVFIDSVILDKSKLLAAYRQNSNTGYITATKTESSDSIPTIEFISGKKDMKILTNKNIHTGLDLYRSNRYLSGWSDATALKGDINTPYDENFPFMLPDGVTIYFASNTIHDNLGGYDIFVSSTNPEGVFLKPRNIGMPFNSPANDYLLVVDERQGIGYFASDRYLPTGKVAVYTFKHNRVVSDDNKKDMDSIRKAALQISFKKSKHYNSGKDKQLSDRDKSGKAKFNFLVKDSIVYRNYSDFQDSTALNGFHRLEQVQDSINITEKRLMTERKRFVLQKDSAEATSLVTSITEYEQTLKHLKNIVKKLTKEIRRLENK